jgi:hypothetical protein
MKKTILSLLVLILISKIAFSNSGPDICVIRSEYNQSQKQYQKFVSTITLKNIGNDSVLNFNVTDLYFSKDSIFDSNDVYGGFVTFTNLAPNDSTTLTLTGGAKSFGIDADSSYKYVIVKADIRDEVTELNENNNIWVAKISIQNAKVDLAVANFTLESDTLHLGDLLDIRVNIINNGIDNVHNTFYEFFLSPDSIFDISDTKIGYLNYALFNWTNHFSENTSLAIPNLDVPNKYYVFVRINTQGQQITINDYNLNNNIVLLDTIYIIDRIANSTLNFDESSGTKTWTEDGYSWSWDNSGSDRIRNYDPHSGSGHAVSSADHSSKLSTTSLLNIKGLWLYTSMSYNFDHLKLLGLGEDGSTIYSEILDPSDFEYNYSYLTLNWLSVKSIQFDYSATDNMLPIDLFYDDMDYSIIYKADTINRTGCDSLVINERTYKASGFYTQNLINSIGGDSTLVFNVSINKSTTSTITVSSCDSIVVNGYTYKTSGLFAQTLINSVGCDSIITINLTVVKSTKSTIDQQGCDSVTINEETYMESGFYIQTLTNPVGCDSIITINLTVLKSTKSTIDQQGCDSLTINGQTFKESGLYTQTLTNSVGCDSIITVNLTVLKSTKSTIDQQGCDSVTINEETYEESGLYTQILTNSVGCDSIITINLSVLKSTKSRIDQQGCDSVTINGETYKESGLYTQTLTNSVGCDSLITLNLNITHIDRSIIQTDSLLTSNEKNAIYQWVNCDNNFQNLINETSQEFQPKKDGNYAVIINQGVCIDTSACYSVSGLSVSIVVLKLLDLKLFPNPNNGKFVLYSENGFNNANIKLYNALGNLVFEKLNYSGFNYSIDMSNEIAGIYFIEVIQNNLISKLKLIKN